MLCPICSLQVAYDQLQCQNCGGHLGFPNVRAASDPSEVAALGLRYGSVQAAALSRGADSRLDAFEIAVRNDSKAVICRPLATLSKILKSGDVLFQTFYRQVALGRIPESNPYDPFRASVDNLFFPFYHDRIHFGALSLDDAGANSYGAGQTCTLVLRATIANRASLFQENTFLYCRRTNHPSTQPIPAGGRATWMDRHRLAVAKLGHSITNLTDPASFPSLLIRVGGSTDDDEFIEVHIHEPLTPAAVEMAILPKVKKKADKMLLKGIMERLRELGVPFRKAR